MRKLPMGLLKKVNVRQSALLLVLALCLSSCGGEDGNESPAPVFEAVNPLRPAQTLDIPYGDQELQFGRLYLPATRSNRLPVLVVIHGGCWQAQYGLDLMEDLSQALVDREFAVWNIEYRSQGSGGEWPHMFEDVAAAIDALAQMPAEYGLDLDSVLTVGHSAGGHMALWLAARQRIPAASNLFREQPQSVRGVLGLAAIADLDATASCGNFPQRIIDGFALGDDAYRQRLRETSPMHMLPTGVGSILFSGGEDRIVLAQETALYVDAANAAGDFSEQLVIAEADHFFLIDPLRLDMNLLEDSLRSFLAAP